MTIALGILARNGVVIAADTQVGMPEYLKMGRGKIAFGTQRSDQDVRMLAITGAGNSHYLEHLQKEFVNTKPHPGIAGFHGHVAERIQDFYRDHVIPFSGYGPAERPDVSLILAARHRGAQVLLSTHKNVVTESYDCCAVGAGEMWFSARI